LLHYLVKFIHASAQKLIVRPENLEFQEVSVPSTVFVLKTFNNIRILNSQAQGGPALC